MNHWNSDYPDFDNVFSDNGVAGDAGVVLAQRMQFPAVRAGFRFLRS
jgi:hypothetical protein